MGKYKRLAESFAHAGSGLYFCIHRERNLRIHLTAAFYVVIAAILAKLNTGEWAAVLLCFALVISMELINTAVEKVCDKITTEYDEKIKQIKDISAAAVLISAAFATLLAIVVFANARALTAILEVLKGNLILGVLLLVSAPFAAAFIFIKRK